MFIITFLELMLTMFRRASINTFANSNFKLGESHGG